MGAIVGVVIGYALGISTGEEGWEEIREAWTVISTSEEVRDLVGAGLSMARGLVGRSGQLLGAQLLGQGGEGDGSALRPVA